MFNVIDDCSFSYTPLGDGTVITTNWPYYPVKSAREQVQDEILSKITEALENNDIKKAKELAKLAKAIKEL